MLVLIKDILYIVLKPYDYTNPYYAFDMIVTRQIQMGFESYNGENHFKPIHFSNEDLYGLIFGAIFL